MWIVSRSIECDKRWGDRKSKESDYERGSWMLKNISLWASWGRKDVFDKKYDGIMLSRCYKKMDILSFKRTGYIIKQLNLRIIWISLTLIIKWKPAIYCCIWWDRCFIWSNIIVYKNERDYDSPSISIENRNYCFD